MLFLSWYFLVVLCEVVDLGILLLGAIGTPGGSNEAHVLFPTAHCMLNVGLTVCKN